jgi:hypothetical protein
MWLSWRGSESCPEARLGIRNVESLGITSESFLKFLYWYVLLSFSNSGYNSGDKNWICMLQRELKNKGQVCTCNLITQYSLIGLGTIKLCPNYSESWVVSRDARQGKNLVYLLRKTQYRERINWGGKIWEYWELYGFSHYQVGETAY